MSTDPGNLSNLELSNYWTLLIAKTLYRFKTWHIYKAKQSYLLQFHSNKTGKKPKQQQAAVGYLVYPGTQDEIALFIPL